MAKTLMKVFRKARFLSSSNKMMRTCDWKEKFATFKLQPDADRGLDRLLIQSDEQYFRIGSKDENLSRCQLMWMPGLHDLPSGAVLNQFCPSFERIDAENEAATAISEIEGALLQRDIRLSRLYFDSDLSDVVVQELRRRGYQRRCEIGLVADLLRPRSSISMTSGLKLHSVSSDEAWKDKLMLHEANEDGPDGYSSPAEMWVELERRKCQTGKMQMYLMRLDKDSVPVGSVGGLIVGNLFRMKNVVIAPQYRGRGFGLKMIHLMRSEALKSGCRFLGCFAVEGEPGLQLYKKAGMIPITCQVEWSRRL